MSESTPNLIRVEVNGVTLAVWEWPGREPCVVFTHGTGFHGRCWDNVIQRLPNRHCFALVARGHGRSSKPHPPYHWTAFSRDFVDLAAHLGISGAIGVGHSMGGHTITAAAAQRPETFCALLLADPIILEPRSYGTRAFDVTVVRTRRDRWPSPEAMFARFRGRPPFDRWQTEVLRDYCEYGILPSDGHFVLACPPEIEASIYHESKVPASNIYPEIAALTLPISVIRADRPRRPGVFDLSTSPTAPDLATYFANAQDELFEDCTHYIPQEAPERVAEKIASLLR